MRQRRVAVVHAGARQRQRRQADADEAAPDSPRVPVGQRLHVTSRRDQEPGRGRPAGARAEIPGVSGGHVPLLGHQQRRTDADARSQRQHRIEHLGIGLRAGRALQREAGEGAEQPAVDRQHRPPLRSQRGHHPLRRPAAGLPQLLLARGLRRRLGGQQIAQHDQTAHPHRFTRHRLHPHAQLASTRRHGHHADHVVVAARALHARAHHPGPRVPVGGRASRRRPCRALDEVLVARVPLRGARVGHVQRETQVLHGVAQRRVELQRAFVERLLAGERAVQPGGRGGVPGGGERRPDHHRGLLGRVGGPGVPGDGEDRDERGGHEQRPPCARLGWHHARTGRPF